MLAREPITGPWRLHRAMREEQLEVVTLSDEAMFKYVDIAAVSPYIAGQTSALHRHRTLLPRLHIASKRIADCGRDI